MILEKPASLLQASLDLLLFHNGDDQSHHLKNISIIDCVLFHTVQHNSTIFSRHMRDKRATIDRIKDSRRKVSFFVNELFISRVKMMGQSILSGVPLVFIRSLGGVMQKALDLLHDMISTNADPEVNKLYSLHFFSRK